VTVAATTEVGARPRWAGRRLRAPAWLGTLPFLAYVGLFLLYPTGILAVDAFKNPSGTWNPGSLSTLFQPAVRGYFIGSFKLCVLSSLTGAVFGALVAYAVASGRPDGTVRRLSVAASGVLAQFGGVTLAFAFQALIGPAGLLFHPSWYYSFPWGIWLIYTYFQIPLMVLVFMPAIDGVKVQWREASESLGSSTWQYWRYIAGPLLAPAFFGSALLLFANALSAFATIQAWENQIAYTVPQQISTSLSSEVGLANVNVADVLALGMIIMVAIIMTGYVLLQRRASRWLR
jgi:putative spermidine/putrescine transport system permease protein